MFPRRKPRIIDFALRTAAIVEPVVNNEHAVSGNNGMKEANFKTMPS